jgi:hypothetical protein
MCKTGIPTLLARFQLTAGGGSPVTLTGDGPREDQAPHDLSDAEGSGTTTSTGDVVRMTSSPPNNQSDERSTSHSWGPLQRACSGALALLAAGASIITVIGSPFAWVVWTLLAYFLAGFGGLMLVTMSGDRPGVCRLGFVVALLVFSTFGSWMLHEGLGKGDPRGRALSARGLGADRTKSSPRRAVPAASDTITQSIGELKGVLTAALLGALRASTEHLNERKGQWRAEFRMELNIETLPPIPERAKTARKRHRPHREQRSSGSRQPPSIDGGTEAAAPSPQASAAPSVEGAQSPPAMSAPTPQAEAPAMPAGGSASPPSGAPEGGAPTPEETPETPPEAGTATILPPGG